MSWLPAKPFLPRPPAFPLNSELARWAAALTHAIADLYTALVMGVGGIHTQHASARCTADTTINSTSRTNVTGCSKTINPRRPADALVWGVFRVHQSAGTVLRGFRGELLVNGAAQAGQATLALAALAEVVVAAQVWAVPNLKANTAYTFQLTGKIDTAGDTFIVAADDSALIVQHSGQLG